MRRNRGILFYLLASLFFTQGVFDCGCLYAAVSPKSASVKTSMPCHTAGKQNIPEKKNCCGACYLAKYALHPGPIEIQPASVGRARGFPDSYSSLFFSAEAALAAPAGHSLNQAAGILTPARSVPFSTPLFLSCGRLLI